VDIERKSRERLGVQEAARKGGGKKIEARGDDRSKAESRDAVRGGKVAAEDRCALKPKVEGKGFDVEVSGNKSVAGEKVGDPLEASPEVLESVRKEVEFAIIRCRGSVERAVRDAVGAHFETEEEENAEVRRIGAAWVKRVIEEKGPGALCEPGVAEAAIEAEVEENAEVFKRDLVEKRRRGELRERFAVGSEIEREIRTIKAWLTMDLHRKAAVLVGAQDRFGEVECDEIIYREAGRIEKVALDRRGGRDSPITTRQLEEEMRDTMKNGQRAFVERLSAVKRRSGGRA
jgi:hypothetical protein